MGKRAKAVVCREWNKPVTVEEVEVESPRRGEVMIQVRACGVCHSDYSATTGRIPLPPPLVLGHEAAGTVVELGEDVEGLAVGDPVLVSWIPMCGRCRYCVSGRPALCDMGARATATLPDGTSRLKGANGKPLHHFAGVAVMAEYATVHADNLIKMETEVAFDKAALVGCAVMTGVGAVLNTAKVEVGSQVAVFGAGGVGLNAIQGAALAGAGRIVAVDTSDRKLEFARTFGATDVVNPGPDADPVMNILQLTGGGVDYAFECIGLGSTIAQAFNCLRKGGTAVVVGVSRANEQTTLGTFSIPFTEKALIGSMYGSARPRVDFPRLLRLYKAKRLKLDELVTATYAIDDAPQAFHDLEKGTNARGVIVF